jgi:hypothetical protein
MLVLEYIYKRKYFFVVLLFLLVSCRKKIDHVVGNTTEIIEGNGLTDPTYDWERVSEEGMIEFHTLQLFNNELYVGGQFVDTTNNFKFIGKLDQNGQWMQALPINLNGNGVYDMEVLNNELIIGGNFYSGSITGNADLIRMDLSGTVNDIPFSNSNSSRVNCIYKNLNNLYVGGYFSPSTTNAIVTKNVEKLVNFTPVGTADAANEVFNLSQRNGGILACGASNKLMGWNGGSTWTEQSYLNKTLNDKVVASFTENLDLYLLGNFSYTMLTLKVMDSFGTWQNMPEISHAGNISQYSKMKKIDQDLFLFGKGFAENGGTVSSVLRLVGSNWYSFCDVQYEVRDIEFFNGYYYIATNYGLYKYK